MQNGIIFELYTDDKKSKYSSNPNNISKSAKTFMKSFIQKKQIPKTVTAELFSKISNKKEVSIKQFHHWQKFF